MALRTDLINVKRKSGLFRGWDTATSVFESDFGVIQKALIINSSEIVRTSLELIQTGSELISTRSELISTRLEEISTSSE